MKSPNFMTLVLGVTAGLVVLGVAPHALAQSDEHDHGAHANETGPTGHDGDVVKLTPEELEEFGIALATAGEGMIEVYASLPGEVRPNDDRLAHIVPRYSGIVIDVRARIGDQVKQGDVLAVVESDDALAPYELRTLIDGTVIGKHITRGEAVSRDRDTYLIADLSTVWVDLTVYQRDIDRIRIGQQTLIYTGHGPAQATGAVSYITPVMDKDTRTATARIVIANPKGIWRPGMFITAKVLVEKRMAAVTVPNTAVHTIDEHPVVFIETEAGLRPREVVLGQAGADRIEVISGLEPGTRYVAVGGFTIKAELAKGAFGDGHGH